MEPLSLEVFKRFVDLAFRDMVLNFINCNHLIKHFLWCFYIVLSQDTYFLKSLEHIQAAITELWPVKIFTSYINVTFASPLQSCAMVHVGTNKLSRQVPSAEHKQ